MSKNNSVFKIINLLRKKGFKSSIRLAIMIYLLMKTKAYFSDIVEDLDVTPGNLWSHLEKLREDGLVKIKYEISNRPRAVVYITDKGLRETVDLLISINTILDKLLSKNDQSV